MASARASLPTAEVALLQKRPKPKRRNGQADKPLSRRGGFGLFHFQLDHAYGHFMAAVEAGNSMLVSMIMEEGHISLEDIDQGSAALESACENEDVSTILVLLDRGVPPEFFHDGNLAPIHRAALNGHTQIIDVLLDHGAKVDLPTTFERRTALHLASAAGRFEAVELLLKRRAYIERQDVYGATPLVLASASGCLGTMCVLLSQQASVNAFNFSGWTGLHLAANSGHVEAVSLLLEHHANINCQNNFGRTPLHCACANDDLTVITVLLDNKPDVNIRDLLERRPHECTDNFLVAELLTPYIRERPPPAMRSIGDLMTLRPAMSRGPYNGQLVTFNLSI